MGQTWYVDGLNGNNANSGLAANLPKKDFTGASGGTGVVAAGFGAEGDTLNLANTIYDYLKIPGADDITIQQWAGMPRADISNLNSINLANLVYSGTPGVFTYAIANGTVDYWTNAGDGNKHYTLTEGIVAVVKNWETSLDANGCRRAFMQLSWTNTAATMRTDNTGKNAFHFAPPTPSVSNGGSGTLTIYFKEEYTSVAAVQATGMTLHFCKGNRNGIEIGTPTYSTYPTWGSFSGTIIRNLRIRGIKCTLWCDPGYRRNKPVSSGSGDDLSGFGAGNALGTVSVGYCIRPADCEGFIIEDVDMEGYGYHDGMGVGDHCKNNTWRRCRFIGGCNNPNGGCSVAGDFYSGPGLGAGSNLDNDVSGCRSIDCFCLATLPLDVDGNPIPYPWPAADFGSPTADSAAKGEFYGNVDGFIAHTNNRAGTSTSVTDGGSTAVFAYTGMFAGEIIVVTSSTTPNSLVGEHPVVSGGGSFSIGVDPGGSGAATWYSKSNSITDVLRTNCKVKYVGAASDNSKAIGSAFKAGGRTAWASNDQDWRTAAVRHENCVVENGVYLLLSGDGDVSFKGCRIDLPRAGAWGITTATGGNLGSISGTNKLILDACEVLMDLGRSDATEIAGFFLTATNKVVSIGSSVLNTASRTSANISSIFYASTPAGTATERVFARQTIFSNAHCSASGASTVRNLVKNGVTSFGRTAFNARDCAYCNFDTNSWITYNGGDAFNTQDRYQNGYSGNAGYTGDPTLDGIDSAGVYHGNDATNGSSRRQPFAELNGRTLVPAYHSWGTKKTVTPHSDVGYNGALYDGSYGAWQGGSTGRNPSGGMTIGIGIWG